MLKPLKLQYHSLPLNIPKLCHDRHPTLTQKIWYPVTPNSIKFNIELQSSFRHGTLLSEIGTCSAHNFQSKGSALNLLLKLKKLQMLLYILYIYVFYGILLIKKKLNLHMVNVIIRFLQWFWLKSAVCLIF